MSMPKTIMFAAAVAVVAMPLVMSAAKAERSGDAETPASTQTIVKSDRFDEAFRLVSQCNRETWPNISAPCVARDADAARLPTRYITVERRDEANQTSTLVRIPVMETATR